MFKQACYDTENNMFKQVSQTKQTEGMKVVKGSYTQSGQFQVIITGGLILGFRNCIDSLYLFENGTKILCDISQFRASIDSLLWLIG